MQIIKDGTTAPMPTGTASSCSSGQTGCITTTAKPSGEFFEAVYILTASYEMKQTEPTVLNYGYTMLSWDSVSSLLVSSPWAS